ncbi:MAG: thiamine phosphate synthase [Alphaproteobacteria bacterium]
MKYSLYFVTPDCDDGHYLAHLCAEAAKGGADVIQLRYKKNDVRQFLALALKIKEVCAHYQIPFIINDRIDVALACNADGVHLGQSDMPIEIARNILGENKIIGLSIEEESQIFDSQNQYADYLAISPVFATDSKKDIKTPLGLKGLKRAVENSNKPVIAIGGINQNNIQSIMQQGSAGVAIISAISAADDICQAAQNLKQEVKKWQ